MAQMHAASLSNDVSVSFFIELRGKGGGETRLLRSLRRRRLGWRGWFSWLVKGSRAPSHFWTAQLGLRFNSGRQPEQDAGKGLGRLGFFGGGFDHEIIILGGFFDAFRQVADTFVPFIRLG